MVHARKGQPHRKLNSRQLPCRLYLNAKRRRFFGSGRMESVWKDLLNQRLERVRTKVVGKPYEGEPHVRFEVAGNGDQDKVGLVRHSQRKREATDRPHLNLRRHSLTLPLRPIRALAFGTPHTRLRKW